VARKYQIPVSISLRTLIEESQIGRWGQKSFVDDSDIVGWFSSYGLAPVFGGRSGWFGRGKIVPSR